MTAELTSIRPPPLPIQQEDREMTSSETRSSEQSHVSDARSRSSSSGKDILEDIEFITSNARQRQLHCRICDQGGHADYNCPRDKILQGGQRVTYCHVCQSYGVDHSSLICPSRAIQCTKCDQFGHIRSKCLQQEKQTSKAGTSFWGEEKNSGWDAWRDKKDDADSPNSQSSVQSQSSLYKRIVTPSEALLGQSFSVDSLMNLKSEALRKLSISRPWQNIIAGDENQSSRKGPGRFYDRGDSGLEINKENSELLIKSLETAANVFENASALRQTYSLHNGGYDELLPSGHTPFSVYCPKCRDDHPEEECDKRMRDFRHNRTAEEEVATTPLGQQENVDQITTASLKQSMNVARGKQKRKLRFAYQDRMQTQNSPQSPVKSPTRKRDLKNQESCSEFKKAPESFKRPSDDDSWSFPSLKPIPNAPQNIEPKGTTMKFTLPSYSRIQRGSDPTNTEDSKESIDRIKAYQAKQNDDPLKSGRSIESLFRGGKQAAGQRAVIKQDSPPKTQINWDQVELDLQMRDALQYYTIE